MVRSPSHANWNSFSSVLEISSSSTAVPPTNILSASNTVTLIGVTTTCMVRTSGISKVEPPSHCATTRYSSVNCLFTGSPHLSVAHVLSCSTVKLWLNSPGSISVLITVLEPKLFPRTSSLVSYEII